jgi:hypothetical protein
MREIKSLKDITVKELIALSKIKDLSTMDGITKVVSIFYGKSDNLSLDEFFGKFTELSKVIFEQPELTPIDHFEFNGVTYTAKGMEEIQTKEFIDFDNISRENPVENLPVLLAIAFTDGNTEGSYVKRTQERAAKFESLDALTAQSAMLFFQQAFVAFANAIVGSLEGVSPKKKEELRKMLESLGGAGI